MKLCIPKPVSDKIKEAFKKSDIKMFDLLNMSTEERTKFFEKYSVTDAKDINTLFEQKLILKNRVQGLKNFISKVTEMGRYGDMKKAELAKTMADYEAKQQTRILSPKENEVFLNDLADKIAGTHISKEQSVELNKLQIASDELRKGIDEKISIKDRTPEQQKAAADYGAARVVLENFTKGLKEGNNSLKNMLSERMDKFKETLKTNKPQAITELIMDTLKTISDNSVSLVATLDNSFMGRQGLKTLMTHPSVWWDGAKNSFIDIAKTLGGNNMNDALWADIYSNPNYLNGSYDIARLIPNTEEQFPSQLPERIPGIGKVFQASETAFTGSAIRMRTGLYDLLAEKAKNNEVDMTDKYNIKSLGMVINSLTAKGQWGKMGEGTLTRLVLWAPRMLKGNIDVLTGHLGQDISPFARKQAGINLLKIVGTTATIMMVANAIKPKSAETDPRSSDFGKIKVGNTRFDYTGGAGSLITLAVRLISNSTKSTTTGMVNQYGTGYGQQTRFDTFINFLAGKTTPPARMLIDIMKGTDFTGKTTTIPGELFNISTPISIQNIIQLKDEKSASAIMGVILDAVGINANTYQPYSIDWGQNTGVELTAFKNKVGDTTFKKANDEYNKTYNTWYTQVKINPKYQILDDATKQKVITKQKDLLKTKIMKEYGFRYVVPKTPKKVVPKF